MLLCPIDCMYVRGPRLQGRDVVSGGSCSVWVELDGGVCFSSGTYAMLQVWLASTANLGGT